MKYTLSRRVLKVKESRGLVLYFLTKGELLHDEVGSFMPLSPDSSRATYPEPEPHGTFGLATKAPGCRMYPQPVSVRFELSVYFI